MSWPFCSGLAASPVGSATPTCPTRGPRPGAGICLFESTANCIENGFLLTKAEKTGWCTARQPLPWDYRCADPSGRFLGPVLRGAATGCLPVAMKYSTVFSPEKTLAVPGDSERMVSTGKPCQGAFSRGRIWPTQRAAVSIWRSPRRRSDSPSRLSPGLSWCPSYKDCGSTHEFR